MDSQVDVENEISRKSLNVFCPAKYCRGVLHEHIEEQDMEDEDCPICYANLNGSLVHVYNPCMHTFCDTCMTDYEEIFCPMCRGEYLEVWKFSKLIKSIDIDKFRNDNHRICMITDEHPSVREYVASIDGEWRRFINFIFQTQEEKYLMLLKGNEILNFDNYRDDGSLKCLEKNGSSAVIEIADDKFQVVLSCLLPNLVIRLIISPIDDIDFEVDNEYADEVIGYINEQLALCWRALSTLINGDHLSCLFVRKFEKITLTLSLLGNSFGSSHFNHQTTKMEQLSCLKECNFDLNHKWSLQSKLPHLNYNNLKMKHDYRFHCSCANIPDERGKVEMIYDENASEENVNDNDGNNKEDDNDGNNNEDNSDNDGDRSSDEDDYYGSSTENDD